MQTLFLATYELGHQPLSLAFPLAVFRQRGLLAAAVDLSVASLPRKLARDAGLVAISAPMHTALRLGVQAARLVREYRNGCPPAHICFYGLYAWMNAETLFAQGLADSVIAGESEDSLASLAAALAQGLPPTNVPGVRTVTQNAAPVLERLNFPIPDRTQLPGLEQYARYQDPYGMHLAGYTEATRGCLHTCRHCPIVPVYQGRFFTIPVDTVLADIRQQVASGARHITFGDPDFLNGPGHAIKVAQALHAEFPQVTFDFTTKVEHIIEKRSLFRPLRELGATLVISAFESTSDAVLARLQKGHTRKDMEEALALLAEAGLPVQPTWVPFTPWTTLEDYIEMLDWIRTHRLIQNVPAVQLAVRLLIPPQSTLLDPPDTKEWLGPLDAENFTYTWKHPDPRMDELQAALGELVAVANKKDPYEVFAAIEERAYHLAGKNAPRWAPPFTQQAAPPRLTEDWFC